MPIKPWQTFLYKDRVDLYRPVYPVVDKEQGDLYYELAYSDVECYFDPTPEVDDARTVIGRTKQVSIFTLDSLYLIFDQEIADAWAWVLRTPDHVDYGACWNVQGNSQDFQLLNHRMVYGKRSNADTGIPLYPLSA